MCFRGLRLTLWVDPCDICLDDATSLWLCWLRLCWLCPGVAIRLSDVLLVVVLLLVIVFLVLVFVLLRILQIDLVKAAQNLGQRGNKRLS